MRAGQAGPALGVKTGLVAPVTVRVYFTRPRAGTDQTNGRSWSNQKPLHRGSRTCRSFAPNQSPFKEDRSSIAFHEKAFKLKNEIHFILVGCALGSGFHADSVWWSRFRSNLAQKGWNVAIWLSK